MRLAKQVLVWMVLAATLVGRPAVAAPGQGAAAVDAEWKRAMEAGDLAAVVACYGADATLWLPGAAEAHGRAAIREAYRGLLDANTVSDVTYTATQYRSSGTLEAGAGDFSLTLTPRQGGAPTVLRGRFSTQVEKQGGRWVYVVDHASTGPAQ